ncbi:MAG: hypothetical protein KGI69_02765 [Patescibacteria group bacterium]|nr:hypothetical protein [Patescibacteria group bacterium]
MTPGQISSLEKAIKTAATTQLTTDSIYEGAAISSDGVVKVNIGGPVSELSFDKDSFIGVTASLTQTMLPVIFGHGYPVSSAVITYLATTTGSDNKPQNTVLATYTVDQKTYDSIDWSVTQASTLCDTLNNQVDANTSCVISQLLKPSQPSAEEQEIMNLVAKDLNAYRPDIQGTSYKSIDLNASLPPGRPDGSQAIIISFNAPAYVTSPANYVQDINPFSTKVFKDVYGLDANITDILLWYYTPDNSNVVSYNYYIDRNLFSQIDWNTFDPRLLCGYLQVENKLGGDNPEAWCNVPSQ